MRSLIGPLAPILASVLLSGCVDGAGPLAALQVQDRGLVTGSIPQAATEPAAGTDEAAALAAVAGASGDVDDTGIPWANPDTGTAGVITGIRQTAENSATCRAYETTRQSYDGIALYAGKACRNPNGAWKGVYFRPKQASDDVGPMAAGSTG